MRYCDGSSPEEHSRKLKCDHCKFSTESESGLQVHLGRKHPEIRNEDLYLKEKNFRWTNQELEFLVETVQRQKKEGLKFVNRVAVGMLPNRTEVAVQRIRTRPEYTQENEKVKQRKMLH